jgi:hypothetical protein
MDPLTIAQLVLEPGAATAPLRAARVLGEGRAREQDAAPAKWRGRPILTGQCLPAYQRTPESRVEGTPEAPKGENT